MFHLPLLSQASDTLWGMSKLYLVFCSLSSVLMFLMFTGSHLAAPLRLLCGRTRQLAKVAELLSRTATIGPDEIAVLDSAIADVRTYLQPTTKSAKTK